MSIVIENLTYVYSPKTPFEKIALKNINLTIEKGEYFGIIGQTGSGKSTLVSHINGLTKLTSGKIVVDDIDLSAKYDYKKLRSKVGMVFQYPEYQLFDDTVAGDVGFGPKNLGLDKDEIDRRVRESLALVGLSYDEIAQRSPFEISGGQKRRVAIAGVIAMNPEILILDEPTAGLDPRGKAEIFDLIDRIRVKCPTIVMISHNMDEIAAHCSRVAVLNNGELKIVATPKELFYQAELISSLGLDVPQITSLALALADKGYAIDKSALSETEFVAEIMRLYNDKKSGQATTKSSVIEEKLKKGDNENA